MTHHSSRWKLDLTIASSITQSEKKLRLRRKKTREKKRKKTEKQKSDIFFTCPTFIFLSPMDKKRLRKKMSDLFFWVFVFLGFFFCCTRKKSWTRAKKCQMFFLSHFCVFFKFFFLTLIFFMTGKWCGQHIG